MTKTPVIIRSYRANELPYPIIKHKDPYVFHDPSFRNAGMNGSNLAPKRIREFYEIINQPLVAEWRQKKIRNKLEKMLDQVNAKKKLIKTNLDIELGITKLETNNEGKILEVKSQEKTRLRTNKNIIFKTVKDAKNISKHNGKSHKIPRKEIKVDFYGRNYDFTKEEKSQTRVHLTSRVISWRSKGSISNKKSGSTNLTLKRLFEKGDPIRLLSLVSPDRIKLRKSTHSEFDNDYYEELDSSKLREKIIKNLITKHGDEDSKSYIAFNDTRKIGDIANVFENEMNVRFAKLFKNISKFKNEGIKTEKFPRISEIDEKLFSSLETVTKHLHSKISCSNSQLPAKLSINKQNSEESMDNAKSKITISNKVKYLLKNPYAINFRKRTSLSTETKTCSKFISHHNYSKTAERLSKNRKSENNIYKALNEFKEIGRASCRERVYVLV